MTKDTGGPAFPVEELDQVTGNIFHQHNGMTLRDWLAGQALSAAWYGLGEGYFDGGNKEIAECAYQIADAMIAERNKP